MEELRAPRFEGSIRLDDGRTLGFAEFGPIAGRPLLWFHGTPGARRQIAPHARALADAHDIRIVSVERPGIGDSSPHGYGALVEYAADVAELLDALGIDRFGVVGLSGGGPYALACAFELEEQCTGAVVLSGMAPCVGSEAVEGGVNDLLRNLSPLINIGAWPLGVFTRGFVLAAQPLGEALMDLFARQLPPGDQRVFDDPAMRQMFREDIVMGARDHMKAIWLDALAFGKHWGFEVSDIRVPVYLRYGDSDNIVPAEHGRHLAKLIPEAVLRILPDEGHLGGLGATHEVFEHIFAHWPDADSPTPH